MPTPHRSKHVALPRTGIRSVPVHLVLAAATAVMLGFSFAPWGLWWFAYIALFPAGMLAARAASAGRLAWTSFAVFWAAWLVMLAWVAPVTQGGYAVLAALMASYWALALVVAHLLHKRYRAAMVVLLPLSWVACEWLRGRFLAGGFGWFAIGHSQASFLPDQPAGRIVQVADLFGELGVSFVVVMTSGLLVDLMTRPILRPIGQGRHRLHRTIRGALVLWLLVLSGSWFYGNYRINQWPKATVPGPRIAVIQTNVPQDNKSHRTPEQDARDWARMVDLTRQAADDPHLPDLIVWPETMIPRPVNPKAVAFFRDVDSYYSGSEVYHELTRQVAQSVGTNLLVGAHAYDGFVDVTLPGGGVGPVPSPRYNSSFLYYADGEQAPIRYDKMHRVPFGEYIPWVSAIPSIKALFIRWFTPYEFDYSLAAGKTLTVFDLPIATAGSAAPRADAAQTRPDSQTAPAVVRIVTPICYEDAVGRVVRRLVYRPDGTKRADLVVNLTNSAWYKPYVIPWHIPWYKIHQRIFARLVYIAQQVGSRQQPQQLQIATIRCIENRVPMARSVNGGISGFVNSVGKITSVVAVGGQSQWVDGFATADTRLDTRQTLYGRLGDLPMTCLAALTAILLLSGKIRPRRASA
jgi:apolipoprotein N-acyltransferase